MPSKFLLKDKNKIMIRYTLLEKLLLPSQGFKIKGFASANSESRGKERFFVIANYGSSEKQKIIVMTKTVEKNVPVLDTMPVGVA